jgi:hypothetical protein
MRGATALLYLGKPKQSVGIKLYEYLGAGRPILVWGRGNEEAARIVESAGAGVDCGTDPRLLEKALTEIRDDPGRFAGGARDRFNRKKQAQWLAERLESLVIRARA